MAALHVMSAFVVLVFADLFYIRVFNFAFYLIH